MAHQKVEINVELESAHLDWITEMIGEFGFEDDSKVLRVLLDYAIQDVDADEIFSPENMRCLHC